MGTICPSVIFCFIHSLHFTRFNDREHASGSVLWVQEQRLNKCLDGTRKMHVKDCEKVWTIPLWCALVLQAGFSRLSSAGGAFYIYADVSELCSDSVGLCKTILDRTGIALTPGVDFDRERGHKFIRFSFCGATESVREVVRLLQEDRSWLSKWFRVP